jgi:hypothetical protein
MKRIAFLVLIFFVICNMNVKSQTDVVSDDYYNYTKVTTFDISSQPAVEINQDMIKIINSVNSGSEYLTWRDLILGFDKQSLSDFYQAYINCDLEKESLRDIKLALEEKRFRYDRVVTGTDEESIAEAVIQSKENNTDGSTSMTVQQSK